MKALIPFLGAVVLAASTSLYAQAPKEEQKGGRMGRMDCSKAQDPKACEERMAKAKEAFGKARAACESQKGPEHRDCMRKQMCAQSSDPAKCEANARERMAKRDEHRAQREKVREACKGKQGDELKSCIREQRGTKK